MRPHGIIGVCCCLAGALLLGLGALVPAHFRAFDRDLLPETSRGTARLVDVAVKAVEEGRFGTAARLFEARSSVAGSEAGEARTNGWERVRLALASRPAPDRWGADVSWLDLQVGGVVPSAGGIPVLEWALPEEVRGALLRTLSSSSHPAVMALLGCRKLERTEVFPAVGTAAGQPFEAVLLIAAALVENVRVNSGLAISWERSANTAIQGRGSAGLERTMLELLSAARRLEWDSLATLTEKCEDPASFETLSGAAGPEGKNWGLVLALMLSHPSGSELASHLRKHGDPGMADLREALEFGTGAVQALIHAGHRIHRPTLRARAVQFLGLGSAVAWLNPATGRVPQLALCLKYLLWMDGLFLILLGLWHVRRSFLDETNRRFDPHPNYWMLAIATATGCILLFLGAERYLELSRPATKSPQATRLPVLRARIRTELPKATTKVMNQNMIAMLVAFFVIQLLIYLIGLARLRHLRARLVEAAVKLRLLDNEESLFDAPLYMGIAGSVLALVLKFTGFEGVSLMASYSSTLFGILFCFVLKVVHVRPYRQRLILESSKTPSA